MPLILHKHPVFGTLIGVWHIVEPEDWFLERLLLNEHDRQTMKDLVAPSKLLEFLASRYLLRILIGSEDEHTLLKDDHGRPVLKNSHLHISVSHCKGYAAALINNRCPAGIDIEPIHARVRKVLSKLLNEDELVFLGGEAATDEGLIIAWTVKEAVYKAHGRKGLSLRSHIHIGPPPATLPGEMQAELDRDGEQKIYLLMIEKVEGNILAYTLD